MATKKKYAARRVLRTPEGGTRIGFFDIETGQEIPKSQLDQYEITSFDFGGKQPKDFEKDDTDKSEDKTNKPVDEKDEQAGDLGGSESTPRNDTGLTAFAQRPGASRGTGNIFEDFKAAYNNLGPRLISDGIRAAGLADDIGRAVGNGVGQAVEGAKENIGNVAYAIGDKVGGFIGGLGGGDPKTAYVNPETVANGAYDNAAVASNVRSLNPDLQYLVDQAALRSPYEVTIISGGDRAPGKHPNSQHTAQQGNDAVDVELRDPATGEVLNNYQDPKTFRAYEQFGQTMMAVAINERPELVGKLRAGAYFSGDIGQGGDYGAADLMHFDLANGKNGLGMLGGSWQNGLNPAQKAKLPGAVSVGMGDLNSWKGRLTPPGQSPIPEIQAAEKAVQAAPTQVAEQQNGFKLPNVAGALQGVMDNFRGMFGQGPATPIPQQNQQAMQAIQQTPQAFAPQPQVAPTPTQAAVTNMNIQPTVSNAPIPPANIPQPAQQTITPTQAAVGQDLPAFTDFQPTQNPIMPTSINPSEFAGQVANINNTAKMDKTGPFNPYNDSERVKDAFLATINYAEGSPKANQLFGYGEIDDLSTHPDQKVFYNEGKDFSTSAGYAQINYPTWREYAPKVGVTSFELPDQKKVAWALANDRYNTYTNGRDLLTDLTSGNQNAVMGVFSSLSKTWSSLPGGSQQRISLQDAADRFQQTLSASYDNKSPVTSKIDNAGSLAYNSETDSISSSLSSQKASDKASNSGFMSSGSESGSLGNSSSGYSSSKTSNTGGFASKSSDKASNNNGGGESGSLGNSSSGYSSEPKTSNSGYSDKSSDKSSNSGFASSGTSSSSKTSSGSRSSSDKNSSKSYDSITSSGPSYSDIEDFMNS